MVPTVEVFDPRIGSWMTGESMNDPRGYSGAVVLGESIYVIGGLKDNEEILDTVITSTFKKKKKKKFNCLVGEIASVFIQLSDIMTGGMLQGGSWLAGYKPESCWETMLLLRHCFMMRSRRAGCILNVYVNAFMLIFMLSGFLLMLVESSTNSGIIEHFYKKYSQLCSG